MSPVDFLLAVIVFCSRYGGSVTSYGRTPLHNRQVGGAPGSAHQFWLGGDVVYTPGTPPPEADAKATARRLGLLLIRESDHDHLQPAGWTGPA